MTSPELAGTGDYFHSSPTRRRAERMVSSSRYKPAARNALSRSPAEGMTPRCLARSTTPSVPMSGMSKALAQARAEASSSTAVQWARSRATPRTTVSPGPSPHSTSSEGMRPAVTRTPQPPSRACRAASERGPDWISMATGTGNKSSPGNCSKSWRWPTLASTITGDALTTQTSFTLGFLDDLFGRVLKRRDPKPAKRAEELGTRESGDLGGSLLGKHFQLIPFHRSRQAQLPGKVLGILAKGGQRLFRHLNGHLDHVCPPQRIPHESAALRQSSWPIMYRTTLTSSLGVSLDAGSWMM